MPRLLSLTTVLVPVLLACGCGPVGPKRAAVSGKVLVDNKPLERGTITFLPANGTAGPSAGGTIIDGEYRLTTEDGPVPGTHRVEIRGFRPSGRMVSNPFDKKTKIEESTMIVPAAFNDRSELVREIVDGSNTLDFDLPAVRQK
jgi:hypothetical protein